MRVGIFVILLFQLLVSGSARAQSVCVPPEDRQDQWAVATPESVDLDADKLCSLIPTFETFTEGNLHAVLVARRGKLVFERYFTGEDAPITGGGGIITFGPETRHDLRSISKSVTALVLGIAIDRGWVGGVDAPVFSFFPEYADLRTPEKDRITLRHLLTMSQGLVWNEDISYSDPANTRTRMNRAADPYRFALEQPVAVSPGEKFVYSGASTALIGAILRKQTGRGIDALAQAHLFEPLGTTDVEWSRYPANGDPAADAGLRMRPRDLAKIGQLLMTRGKWNGKQVVPATWIDAATSRQISTSSTPGSLGYGYQFWLWHTYLTKRGEVPWIAGFGLGGQRLFVAPSLEMVVVINAGLYASYLQRNVPLSVLNNYVLQSTEPR
jgi:CubicO group peptidase (beta-lactamase class C family)